VRLNQQIIRRTDIIGVFPNPEVLLPLATAVLVEQHDKWAASSRGYFSDAGLKQLTVITELDLGVIENSTSPNLSPTEPHMDVAITPLRGRPSAQKTEEVISPCRDIETQADPISNLCLHTGGPDSPCLGAKGALPLQDSITHSSETKTPSCGSNILS
jgi:hypothetical protein